ncbi:MAG: hypothetical protein AMXMBFR84_24580 [Candidatus Hydrogenedentota bacterium]
MGEHPMSKQFEPFLILVADDDTMVADALSIELRNRFGCAVDKAYDGHQVQSALLTKSYDLLITDMLMPGLHGIDLVSLVRREYPTVDILVTTAYPAEFPYVEVIHAGASDFIIKPLNMEEFSAKVLRMLKERVTRAALSRERARILADMESMQELRTAHKLAEAKYRGLFELSMNGMVITDPSTFTIREVNQSFLQLAGLSKDQLVESPFFRLVDETSRKRLEQGLAIISERGQGTLSDIQLHQSNGHKIFVDMSVNFIHIDGEHFVQITCKDVTVQRELQLQLERIAQTDSLTGLLNKNMFHPRIENAVSKAIKNSEPLTLLLLDLDNFKQCNDTYGHQTGDSLLSEMGELIRRQVRGNVDEAYRIGGDEFAILLIKAGSEIGMRVGERIRKNFMDSNRYGTSLSIGICELQNGMDAANFIKSADRALYDAKSAGKNTIRML